MFNKERREVLRNEDLDTEDVELFFRKAQLSPGSRLRQGRVRGVEKPFQSSARASRLRALAIHKDLE